MSGLTKENRQNRVGVITASAWAKIAKGGMSRLRVLERIAAERATGESQEASFTSKAMAAGIAAEPEIIRVYESFLNPDEFEPPYSRKVEPNDRLHVRAHEGLIVGATPDGLLWDGEPVEVKFPKWENFEKQIDAVPVEYQWQVKFQAFVLEKDKGHLVLGRENSEGKVEISPFVIDLDEDDKEIIVRLLREAERDINTIQAKGGEEGEVNLDPRVIAMGNARRRVMAIEDAFKAAKKLLEEKCKELLAPEQEILAQEEALCLQVKGDDESVPAGIRRTNSKKVVVSDVAVLPDAFVKKTPELTKIKKAIESGDEVAGAAIEESVSYRVLPGKEDVRDADEALREFARVMSVLSEAATGGQNDTTEKQQ